MLKTQAELFHRINSFEPEGISSVKQQQGCGL